MAERDSQAGTAANGAHGAFAGKLAVVTGGGSGMGRELVRQLAAAGCSVAASDWHPDTVADTAARAQAGAGPGARVTGHVCDVSDEAQVLRFNTSSVNGIWASLGPGIPSNSAAKFAVRGFTEGAHRGLAEQRAPGPGRRGVPGTRGHRHRREFPARTLEGTRAHE